MNHIVILVADDYQDLEVWYPLLRLREAGLNVVTAGTQGKTNYKGKNGYPITVNHQIEELSPDEFGGIIIPGGWAPDFIRRNEKAIQFVSTMDQKKRLVAGICHAGWVLASANVLKGKRCTSFFAIKDDMINAGGLWEDKEVVIDGNLITSRTPDDLPAFCLTILKAISDS